MKFRFILPVFIVIAVVFLVAGPVSAQVTNGDDDVVADTTVSVSNGGDDVVVDSATLISNGDDDTDYVAPVVVGDTSGTVSNGDDDTEATPVIVAPVKTDTTSNGGSGRSSRRSTSGGSSSSVTLAANAGLSCPVITTSLLKIGNTNNTADVTRLQSFLKNVEKLDVDVNGTFDAKTEAGVKAFQLKHKDVILAPWNATRASGVVFITTSKKINEVACGTPLTLNSSELNAINAYNQRNSGTVTSGTTISNVKADETSTEVTPAPNTTDEGEVIGSTETETNTATASDAPVLKRFWNFLTGLFR